MANHVNRVNKDTVLCISLAARPSNHGVRFHNFLFAELELNYLYKAVAPVDITQSVEGIRGLGIRGAAVSMPFKQEVIELIDALDPSAERIHSVNTIVNDNGVLTGYNTDYSAVKSLLDSHDVDPSLKAAVKGSGGMANAVVAALADHGISGVIVARNAETGTALAKRYSWAYSEDVPAGSDLLVNVTPLGMLGPDADALAFTHQEIEEAQVVFDVVANPVETPLIKAARVAAKPTIDGGEVVALQAAEQFTLYTGVVPSDEQVQAAEDFSQQG